MKRFLLIAILLIYSVVLSAQAPSSFNYQSVIHNAEGELVTNQNINFRFQIFEGSASGPTIYSETQIVKSNDFGVCSIKVGTGADASGSLDDIDWGSNSYFLNVAVDITGSTSFTDIGTTELVSVPYALYAKNVESVDNEVLHFPESDTLFAVRDHDGNIVFAVFPDGAKVYVNEGVKGPVGGFAVTGRNPGKAIIEEDYILVTPDSTRVWVNEEVKGRVGGFAVTGRNPGKGDITKDYFNVSGNSEAEVVNNESRVMWYPKKAALLAGEVHVGASDSVGTNSTALGYRSIAKGNQSQSFGYKSKAFGNYSTAIGNNAIASARNSFAFGVNVEAVGISSFVVGSENIASGHYSNALGRNTRATGMYSFAIGEDSEANGYTSVAIGATTISDGEYSIAIGLKSEANNYGSFSIGNHTYANGRHALALGSHTEAEDTNSISIGYFTKSYGKYATAMGINTMALSYSSFVVGSYNKTFSSANKYLWVDTDPIFVIGNGKDWENRSNAVTVLKNGNFGIGTLYPGELLEVYNGTSTGTYTTSGWLHSSDERLKTNIIPITNALNTVLNLDGVYFNWKADSEKRQVGFIAQDVEKILPEVVSVNKEGYYSLSYGNMTPLLIEAFKEQNVKIEEQQQTIEDQKSKISNLEERLSEIEKLLLKK